MQDMYLGRRAALEGDEETVAGDEEAHASDADSVRGSMAPGEQVIQNPMGCLVAAKLQQAYPEGRVIKGHEKCSEQRYRARGSSYYNYALSTYTMPGMHNPICIASAWYTSVGFTDT